MERSADANIHPPLRLRAPYLGLATFGDSDEDAKLFFGRGTECDLVIANLRSAQVTVLYGPSGVGKSSLLHAGVAHRLRTTQHPSSVIVLDEWTGNPTAALTAGVAAAATAGAGSADPDLPLTAALDELRTRRTRALLVILDRFEDYLRLYPAGNGDAFTATLATLLAPRDVRVRLLIALREDRLAELDRLDGLVPALFGNVLRLDPLSREEAREAITGPLQHYNDRLRAAGGDGEITLERGLVDDVLDDLGDLSRQRPRRSTADERSDAEAPIEPAFLSLTMRRIWDADVVGAGSKELRRSTLAALGGAASIFANHLDSTMNALSASEQRLAADVLRFLVAPSGATQRFSAADLADYVNRSPPEVEALAEKLSHSPARVLRAVETPGDAGTHVEYEPAHQVLAEPMLDWRRGFETAHLQRRGRRLLLALAAVSAIALALVGYAIQPTALARLELSTVDARFAVRGPQGPDPDIVLVTFGAATIARFSAPGAPALPRETVARGLNLIADAGPRVIACDIDFAGQKSRVGDQALIAAVQRDKALLVLATNSLQSSGTTTLFGRPHQTFADYTTPAAGWGGFPGDSIDAHPVVRTMEQHFPLAETGSTPMETLAVVTARHAGLSASTLHDAPTQTWIDFRGGAGTFPTVSFDDVLAGRPAALSKLRGRIVVFGNTAPQVYDTHDTSAPGRSRMSGPELQANAISTAMRGFPLRDAGRGVDVVLIVFLGMLPLALGLRFGPLPSAAGLVLAGLLFCVAAQLAFDAGHVISVVFPLISLGLSGVGVLVIDLLRRRWGASVAEPATLSA
ncbi:MAG: CHASE2 domain-containing protein [Solirubrobacteraceae bacterium]